MGKTAGLSPFMQQKIAASFAAQSLMQTFGATLGEMSPGAVEITAPLLPGSLQQHGFGHAGLTFAIGDSAAGYAALTVMPEDHEVLTAEMKINLLAPAKGNGLLAKGRVIKPGRRLVIVQADIYALDGPKQTHVALMTGTMIPVLSASAR